MNHIKTFPENIFDKLTNLIYLDIRDNKLTMLPKKIIKRTIRIIEST